MRSTQALEIQYEVNGLRSLRETRDGSAQPRPHSHNEIEVLLLETGSGVWLMGGELVTLKPGQLVVFWALRPHQIIKSAPNTVINWLDIPLTVFIEWKLPEYFSKLLLAGHILLEPERAAYPFDKSAFARWHQDLPSNDPMRQKLALLEIQARLGRLALSVKHGAPKAKSQSLPQGMFNHAYFDKISQIAEVVSKKYQEPLTVADIAQSIGMHPTTATKLFKKICGMNLMHYLTQHRIFHAQRLLTTTDMKILDVALESGYQSVSRFYAAFKEFCGMSPQEFRNSDGSKKVSLEKQAGVWRIEKSRPPHDLFHKLKSAAT